MPGVIPGLIPMDDALAASSLERSAELNSLIACRERADHAAVVDPAAAKIGAAYDRRAPAENIRVAGLERSEGGLGIGLAAL